MARFYGNPLPFASGVLQLLAIRSGTIQVLGEAIVSSPAFAETQYWLGIQVIGNTVSAYWALPLTYEGVDVLVPGERPMSYNVPLLTYKDPESLIGSFCGVYAAPGYFGLPYFCWAAYSAKRRRPVHPLIKSDLTAVTAVNYTSPSSGTDAFNQDDQGRLHPTLQCTDLGELCLIGSMPNANTQFGGFQFGGPVPFP
jgi:hypothetical protein